jgi:hypothetical protein
MTKPRGIKISEEQEVTHLMTYANDQIPLPASEDNLQRAITELNRALELYKLNTSETKTRGRIYKENNSDKLK